MTTPTREDKQIVDLEQCALSLCRMAIQRIDLYLLVSAEISVFQPRITLKMRLHRLKEQKFKTLKGCMYVFLVGQR